MVLVPIQRKFLANILCVQKTRFVVVCPPGNGCINTEFLIGWSTTGFWTPKRALQTLKTDIYEVFSFSEIFSCFLTDEN
jgi:hypothetical protein